MLRPERLQVARDLFIVALAVVSVGIGIVEISDSETGRFTRLDALDLAIVAVFWVDFVLEARRAGLGPYVRSHWWEIPSLIPPVPALLAVAPFLAIVRALRLLRLARVIGILLRLRPAGSYVVRLARRARVDVILGIGASVTLVGAALMYALESKANPDVASFGEAAWFAFNMFTNVAFVDARPATVGGRIVAGVLQLCGIAFIGIFTASLAAAIVREPAPVDDAPE